MVMFPWNVAMIKDPTHADDFSAQLSYSVDEGRLVTLTEIAPLAASTIVNVLEGTLLSSVFFFVFFFIVVDVALRMMYDDRSVKTYQLFQPDVYKFAGAFKAGGGGGAQGSGDVSCDLVYNNEGGVSKYRPVKNPA